MFTFILRETDTKLPKRSRAVGRKYVSGWEKKKKKTIEASANKQKGTLHKFSNDQNLKVKTWPLLMRLPKQIL